MAQIAGLEMEDVLDEIVIERAKASNDYAPCEDVKKKLNTKKRSMPKLAIYKNLIFYIVMFDLTERYHVHVANNKTGRNTTAKIWLDTLELFEQGSLTEKEITTALKFCSTYNKSLIEQIEKIRAGEKTKTLKIK